MFLHIKKMTAAAILMSAGLLVATVALAAPKLGEIAFSTSEDGDAVEVFKPDTAKIYLNAELQDADAGTKISTVWIAEKTDAAPANYTIDSVDFVTKEGMNEVNASLSKPNAGWPIGDYRVELSINGKPAGSAHFKVAK